MLTKKQKQADKELLKEVKLLKKKYKNIDVKKTLKYALKNNLTNIEYAYKLLQVKQHSTNAYDRAHPSLTWDDIGKMAKKLLKMNAKKETTK